MATMLRPLKVEGKPWVDSAQRTAAFVGKRLNQAGTALCEGIEAGKRSAGRVLKRGRVAVEDGAARAQRQIKRHPAGSIAISFVAGAALAFLVPRLVKR
jgi:hypothetical protein